MTLLVGTAPAAAQPAGGAVPQAVYLATRDAETGTVRVVLRRGGKDLLLDSVLDGSRWRAFDLRGVPSHDPGSVCCVREVTGDDLPRIHVRGDFQIVAFTDGSGVASGVAAIGPWGVRSLLSSDDERYRIREEGAHVAPGGGHLGLVLEGVDPVEEEEEEPAEEGAGQIPEAPEAEGVEGPEEVVILDIRGAAPTLHHVVLPGGVRRVLEQSLTLTEDAAFFTARESSGEWSVLRVALETPPDSPPATAERIAGPFEEVSPYMAASRGFVAFVAGGSDDEFDIFVAGSSGAVTNVTSQPDDYLEHRPDDQHLAVTDDGSIVAYNLDIGGEPEVYVHGVAEPGPSGRVHVTRDGRFNPYIDQESLIFFTSFGLVFAAGHDRDTTDVFRIDTGNWEGVTNLTRTGSSLEPPFLFQGTLEVRDLVVGSGDLLLVSATGFPWPDGPSSAVQLVSATNGETAVQGSAADQATEFFRVGSDLYFRVQSPDGSWTLSLQRGASITPIASVSPADSPPRLLLLTPGLAYYSMPGVGVLELREGSDPLLLAEAQEIAPYAAISADGALLAFGRSDGLTTQYVLVDLQTGAETLLSLPADGALLSIGQPAREVFVRGDANRDGTLDVSDPISILAYLFLGQFEATCLDAADTDDDGSVWVTDAIVALQFLFQDGPTLPPPHPEPGVDPTADDLGCPPG